MTATDLPLVTRRRKREHNLRELTQFKCSMPWIATGVGGAVAASLAIAWGGWPAAAAIGSLGTAGLAYGTLIEARAPVLERVTIQLPNLPPELHGLRIGHLSDHHLGMLHSRANTQWAIRQMLIEQPDLIVLNGDFVSFEWAINSLNELFRPLQAALGIYAVVGNHDHWEGVTEIYEQLEPLGIQFLVNDNRCIRWRGAELWLAGIDDMWYGTPDLNAALAGIPADAFTILLAHEPDFADIAALRAIDLQLSGHTHGGQVHMPVLGAACLPYHGLRYISGLMQADAMQIYVSRGLGGLPLRINCPPEAAILTLQRAM